MTWRSKGAQQRSIVLRGKTTSRLVQCPRSCSLGTLVITEVVRPVLEDRSPDRTAKLVPPIQWRARLLDCFSRLCELIVCIEGRVAEIFEDIAMDLVGS